MTRHREPRGSWVRRRGWMLVLAAVLGASCGESRSDQDADTGVDAAPADAAPADGGTDAYVDRDASGLACYPVVVSGTTWYLGENQGCQILGFYVSDAERTAASALAGVSCGSTMPYECFLWSKSWGPVTRAEYEDLCRIEAALGPRTWDCQQD